MNIFVMALEPLENRYTSQWLEGIPNLLKSAGAGVQVFNIVGTQSDTNTSTGAFLNFVDTNTYKTTQFNALVEYFKNHTVQPHDKILFVDAWNSTILQTKYISELTDIPVQIHSIWHAGSYDPADFLGRKIPDKNWSYNAERSFYYASDYNYFATKYHKDLFEQTLGVSDKSYIVGQPHNQLVEKLKKYPHLEKDLKVIFPHRLSTEKQYNIFSDLADVMHDVDFYTCQDKNLTKDQYHYQMAKSLVCFSASHQETFGISQCVEAPLLGVVPFMPDRLSYSEIFKDYPEFLYPSNLTENWATYKQNRDQLVYRLYQILEEANDSYLTDKLSEYVTSTLPHYALGDKMVEYLVKKH